MSREIKNFNNGLDVDKAVDEMKDGAGATVIENFLKDAKNAEFIVPYRDAPTQIQLLNLPEKGLMFPAFSCYEAFIKSGLPEDKTVFLTFSKINSIVKSGSGKVKGIVVNPHGKSLIFEQQKKEPGEMTVQKGGQRTVSMLRSVSPSIIAALCDYFSSNEKVYKAYLLQTTTPEDQRERPFLVVDFDGDPEEFFKIFRELLVPYLEKGTEIEMAKADFRLLTLAEKITKPFYKKH